VKTDATNGETKPVVQMRLSKSNTIKKFAVDQLIGGPVSIVPIECHGLLQSPVGKCRTLPCELYC
jgi:hypothetical protein